MSALRNTAIKLAYRTAAQITRIFILFFRRKGFIDLPKSGIRNHRFSAQYQFSLKRDLQRYIIKHTGITGNDFSYLTITAGNCLLQGSLLIRKYDSKPIHFPRKQTRMLTKPSR